MTKKRKKTLINAGSSAATTLRVNPVPPTRPLEAEQNRPEAYQEEYSQEVKSLLDGILAKEDFSYDMNADPLYQKYRDMYLAGGRNAMEDAMGQAAALTGGYMNSYAATAGSQAYEKYLAQLDDRALSLYDRAYGRFADQKANARDNLSTLLDYDDRAYARYRDQVSDWQDMRDYEYQKVQDAQDQANWQREYDYKTRKWKKRPTAR